LRTSNTSHYVKAKKKWGGRERPPAFVSSSLASPRALREKLRQTKESKTDLSLKITQTQKKNSPKGEHTTALLGERGAEPGVSHAIQGKRRGVSREMKRKGLSASLGGNSSHFPQREERRGEKGRRSEKKS